jgi:hypothetical protein
MAHSFKTNSGKTTFGVFKEPQDAGQYIQNKKAKTTFCNPNACIPRPPINTQNNKLLLNNATYLKYKSCDDFNKSNLDVNLITSLDLSGVPVIQLLNSPYTSPTDIDPTVSAYETYLIDPCGNLFGNTTCGIYNYLNYLVYNPPSNINNNVIRTPYTVTGSYNVSQNPNFNTIITFTGNGNINFNESISVNMIIVGGGGGGGTSLTNSSYFSGSGGGGGGGVIYVPNYSNIPNNVYTITVGAGGTCGAASGGTFPTAQNGTNGASSKITLSGTDIFTAIGGYGGLSGNAITPNVGGSGGVSGSGGPGGQGGTNVLNGSPGTNGGGGGGPFEGGYGGNGGASNVYVPIYGNYYGGGGGGAGGPGLSGTGAGGGGNGSPGNANAENAVTNSGGGGGGGTFNFQSAAYLGGNGGSGVVILFFNV